MTFYHYCSVDTLKNILSSNVFWLSNLTESNDDEEVIRSFKNLWQSIKPRLLESDLEDEIVSKTNDILDHQFDLEIQIDPPYGTCFCYHADLLQQWNEYGDNTKGVSLGFDFDWFKELSLQMPHPSTDLLRSIGYDKVFYHDKSVEDGFYKLCYDAIKAYGLNAWIMGIRPTFKHYSAFIKNPTFFGEQEIRIVYYPVNEQDLANNILNLSGPIENPFLHYCLPWVSVDGVSALDRIILGCNCSLNDGEIKALLKDANITNNVDVFRSSCSYRLRE